MLLHQIRSPEDVKRLSPQQADALTGEIRDCIVRAVSKSGGHLASNLGMVELTVALHRVFDSPKDKIIFDVGHQCYAHKILTGRAADMDTLRQLGGISGFPRREESCHDAYGAGHASTAISAALGLARARDLNGTDEHIVAVVGDGALTGGMCYEAMNDAGSRKTRLIVILNDNQMSIAPNVGAVSNYLTFMRTSKGWLTAKKAIVRALLRIPLAGPSLHRFFQSFKNHIRNVFVKDGLFQALGFRYLGPIDGHDVRSLETFLRRAKNLAEPVLLHVVTKKGIGYAPAENRPDRTHGMPPFNPEDGLPLKNGDKARSFGAAAGRLLADMAGEDGRIVAVTAAMADATGFGAFKNRWPERLFDVGIAEEHAVTLAAGMAAGGLRPFVAVYDTFLQRGYDQIVMDVCQQNLPVCFLMDRAAIGGEDGPTHHGVFGLAYLRHIPNLQVLMPRCVDELRAMIRYAIGHNGPVAIRYPRGELAPQPAYAGHFVPGQWETLRRGEDMALLAAGTMTAEALKAADLLAQRGINASVISASSVKPLDDSCIQRLSARRLPYVTMEEHVLAGGFGSAVAEHCAAHGLRLPDEMIALPDAFIPHGAREDLIRLHGLDSASIAARVSPLANRTA